MAWWTDIVQRDVRVLHTSVALVFTSTAQLKQCRVQRGLASGSDVTEAKIGLAGVIWLRH